MIAYVGLDLGVSTSVGTPVAPKLGPQTLLQRREVAAVRRPYLESVSIRLSQVPDIRLDFD